MMSYDLSIWDCPPPSVAPCHQPQPVNDPMAHPFSREPQPLQAIRNTSTNMADDNEQLCFICLDGPTEELGELGHHCKCLTRPAHKTCLLRWQLQQAGNLEEKQCRFCKSPLGDWRSALGSEELDGAPLMSVTFQGKKHKVPVSTGPDGAVQFKKAVCKLFNLPEDTDFEITFECKSPIFGDKLRLKGFQSFEAATYCAAVASAKHAKEKQSKAAAASATKAASASSKRSSTASKTAQPTSTSSSSSSSSAAAGTTTTTTTSSFASYLPRILSSSQDSSRPAAGLPRTRSVPAHLEPAPSSGAQLDSDTPLPSVHLDGAHTAAPGLLEPVSKAPSQGLRTSLSTLLRRML